jgi:hypothetical protein
MPYTVLSAEEVAARGGGDAGNEALAAALTALEDEGHTLVAVVPGEGSGGVAYVFHTEGQTRRIGNMK